jgi:hypothetical protein
VVDGRPASLDGVRGERSTVARLPERPVLPVQLPYAGGLISFSRSSTPELGADERISNTALDALLPDWYPEDFLDEYVLVFRADADVASWFEAVESCVGEEWVEPPENVTRQRYESPDLGDVSAGFHTIYADDEDVEHDQYDVLVQVGDVLVMIEYTDYDLAEPMDQVFFAEVVEAAADRVEATLG